MKKLLLVIMVCMAFTMQAQDRLEPNTGSTLEGYDADVKKFLSDGSNMLWLVMPSNMAESSLCWNQATGELISTKAVSVIWNYNLYKDDNYRRNPETEAPRLEKHRLWVPAETERLIEGLLEDAVKTAMYPQSEMFAFDGTSYTFFSGRYSATHHHGAGEKVKELLRVTHFINQAVIHENLDELNAIVPDIKALRTKFRESYPDDVFEGRKWYSGTTYDDGTESAEPKLDAAGVTLVWKETAKKEDSYEFKNKAEKKAEDRREAFIQQYGTEYGACLKKMFVSSEFFLNGCGIYINVSTLPTAKPTLVIPTKGRFTLILPAKQLTPKLIERYMQGIVTLQHFCSYRYDNGWQKLPDDQHKELSQNLYKYW